MRRDRLGVEFLLGVALLEATAAVVDAVTAELQVSSGERAPAARFDPRRDRSERRTA